MLIQGIYNIIRFLNNCLHFLLDWTLNVPGLKYLATDLLWFFDGYKAVQYRLLFEEVVNLQPDQDVYSYKEKK